MLPRRFRLRRRSDLQRVRRQGRRLRHPLAVFLVSPTAQKMNQMSEGFALNGSPVSRFAFSASRRVGNAVLRNRAKRMLRAAVQSHLAAIEPGWDCLFIAREQTPYASFSEVTVAVKQLLLRARLVDQQLLSEGSQEV